jgi:DNA-binding transcriptional LysR family regulator
MFERLFARRGLSIDRLRVLCELSEAGGIAKAAGSDPARQSQFSRQLSELEEFFEVALTRRQGKGLVLTEAGRELAVIARESIGRLHDFHARASAQPVSFSIGAGESLLQWLVLPQIAALAPQLRGVDVRVQNLRTAEITNRLHDLSLDFGLVRREAVSPPLKCVFLGKMEYALFHPTSRFAKAPDVRRVIETLPLALQCSDGVFTRQFWSWVEKNGLKVSVKIECDAFPQAARALLSGQCAAILPKIARVDLPGDAFRGIDVPFLNNQPRQVCLAWNPRTIRLRTEAQDLATRLTEGLKF